MSSKLIRNCWLGFGALTISWFAATSLARAETYQASADGVEAIVTERCLRTIDTGSCAESEKYIRISHPGRSHFETKIPVDKYYRPIRTSVKDLDSDGEKEVLVDLTMMGGGCCSFLAIYSYNQQQQKYLVTLHSFGYYYRYSSSLGHDVPEDINGDGTSEFVVHGARVRSSGANAGDRYPIQIWRYVQGKMVDVSSQYPQQVRSHAFQLWQEFTQRRSTGYKQVEESILAAYLADKYYLGEAEDGWRRIREALGGLSADFLTQVQEVLEREGHALIPQGSQNAEARSHFGITWQVDSEGMRHNPSSVTFPSTASISTANQQASAQIQQTDRGTRSPALLRNPEPSTWFIPDCLTQVPRDLTALRFCYQRL
jgi:hypothetical protein